MSESIQLEYTVPGNDFTRAGEASADLKSTLKRLGLPAAEVRRIAIALYEGRGFVRCGLLPDAYRTDGGSQAAVLMSKALV